MSTSAWNARWSRRAPPGGCARAPPIRAGCWSPDSGAARFGARCLRHQPAEPACPRLCALRREAWLRLADVDAGAAQMNGRVVEIAYSREDLKEIFLKNIAVEAPERLCDRHAEDPIIRFVGAQNATLVHEFSGNREDLFSFVLRHTLLRPRIDGDRQPDRADPAGPAHRGPAEGGRPPRRGRECPVLPGGGQPLPAQSRPQPVPAGGPQRAARGGGRSHRGGL